MAMPQRPENASIQGEPSEQHQPGAFERVVEQDPLQDPSQTERQAFARSLDEKVASGRLEPWDASYQLSRYDNAQLVRMNENAPGQSRDEQPGERESAADRQQTDSQTRGLSFYEDSHPSQTHEHDR